MRSIRARLTIGYAGAMIGTMVAFAVALWTARRAGSYDELSRHVLAQANLASTIIEQASSSGQQVTVLRDTLVGPTISPALRTLLEGMEGYVLVLDQSGRMLYGSFAVLQLSEDDRATLQREAISVKPGGHGELLDVGGDRLVLVAVNENMDVPNVQRVVAAESVRSTDIAVRELLGTILAVAPLLLMASVGLAYMIAGRAFQPVGQMINEVKAITDGRSLHRRLPIDESNEEMARLGITLNEMMERLEISFSALRRFTADASHELKTPLAVLRADVERSMSGASTRAERMVALEEALHETTRMADLVESLLTLARADEGRFDLHRERVELEPLAREVYETATILSEPAGLTVTMAEPARVAVFGDRARLRQLFLNLTTNAIKYTPRGGSVDISLTSYEHTAAFAVRDSGIGISASDLPHIFERFYRADRARSRGTERSGFGLGLAISQWIAEAHGGSISVRSRYGRGSTFTVTLPVSDEEPDRVLREGAEGPAAA
ncbi:MAG TPA: HAMP domain-containing sensor histidine kinase [Gemmatimonadaceae bacterium]|nr:HAMP domain-containing sensor histidine kinase [Gemmatimonadaceae bacterium]